MTEIEFEKAVVELAHLFDWKVASFRPAQTGKGWRTPVKYDGKGWPDLVLISPLGGGIFAEIKTDDGKLSPEQKEWGNILTDACMDTEFSYAVWRPRMSSLVAMTLSFGRITDWRIG